MRLATLLCLTVLAGLVAPAFAQTPGTCAPGTAEADLDISDVFARVFNGGNLFFGNTTVAGDGYLVPKFSGNSPIFAAGIWIGGTVGGDLRVAGSTYSRFEFWPGPLEPGAMLPDPDDCSLYDRIWVVSIFDLDLYETEGVATTDLAEWPVDLGAPVIDGDGVAGNYNLEGGDRPEVLGHQTAFWVMNDVGNTHDRNLTLPIGLEVRVTAFASAESLLQRHTFYRYEVINRNTQPFEAARFGLFVDPDLGDAADDYVGSDSTRQMAFVYNGSETDSQYGTPPAAGYDFLNGAGVSMYFVSAPGIPTTDPATAEDIYSYLNGTWLDGTPLTEGGDGYMEDGPILTWTYPGDPVTDSFWSEVNTDGDGEDNPQGDRRHIIATDAFTLAPGESRSFDIAILFAQGEDRFDSITELRAASDAVQARHDAGELFAPSTLPLPPAGALPTPTLLSPADGSVFVDQTVTLDWTPVTGAEGYRVEVSTDPTFAERRTFSVAEPPFVFAGPTTNEVLDYSWRVLALADGLERSFYSDPRTFTLYRYGFDNFGDGIGVVEISHPDAEVCPDEGDPGCAEYGGNAVWLSPNSTDDYVLTNEDNDLDDLVQSAEAIDSDLEVRFTEACADPGACLAVYGSALPGGNDLIASVPFELWNAGLEADPGDDVRMIPFLRAFNNAPTDQWADTFPDSQEVIVEEDTVTLSVTQRVLGLMPDRPNGYALFNEAATGFGGPGATYDPENDSDTQVDSLTNGTECRRQQYYTDFCYRDASSLAVVPLGGLNGFVLADLAGDGTTPPAGTTIRFDAPERLLEVSAEDDAPSAQPQTLALAAAYPNPFRAATTLLYRLEQAADVQLSVYDVLGRRVAVLAKGRTPAGDHRATFEGQGLASGVYFVVLEADGQRAARKVMIVR